MHRSAGPEQDEAEKALNLILDLVKLSKSGTQEPVVSVSVVVCAPDLIHLQNKVVVS